MITKMMTGALIRVGRRPDTSCACACYFSK